MSLFLTAPYGGMLGLLLLSAQSCLYARGFCDSAAIEDQQLAGAIMWALGGMVYGGAAVALSAAGLLRSRHSG